MVDMEKMGEGIDFLFLESQHLQISAASKSLGPEQRQSSAVAWQDAVASAGPLLSLAGAAGLALGRSQADAQIHCSPKPLWEHHDIV